MKRFSQRNQLVTLSEINITPLLDLAFVLLIIFVITTPLLEQSLKLNLPQGGRENSRASSENMRTIEISPDGAYVLNRTRYTLAQLEQVLVREFTANPQLAFQIRVDKSDRVERMIDLMDLLDRHNMRKIGFSTVPRRK